MKAIEITAGTADNGSRLDVFIAARAALSRTAAARLIESGNVRGISGNRALTVSKNTRVSEGEIWTVEIPETAETGIAAQDIPLDARYEDDDLIVINKPRGMVVHPAPGHPDGTLVNALMAHCGDTLSGIGGEKRPGIVHRIDKDTAGLIIAAKNDFAHQKLSAQLKDHTLSRTYDAVCRGNLRDNSGTINAPIGRHPVHRKKQAVNAPRSRNAVTHYEVTGRGAGYTRVLCRLETGRTHQIRVHFQSIGHPLAGDALYGGADKLIGNAGQCLFAAALEFIHPRSGERVKVECEAPRWYIDVLRKTGLWQD